MLHCGTEEWPHYNSVNLSVACWGPASSRHFNNRIPGCLDATIKIGIPLHHLRLWVFDNQSPAASRKFCGAAPPPPSNNDGLVELGRVDLDQRGSTGGWRRFSPPPSAWLRQAAD